MTDLTEQWKARKLEEFYGKPFYIKKQNGVIKVDYLSKYGFVNNYDVVEVLAPVPSYEEWQEEQEAYCKEKEENQQLKTLLREWKYFYPIVLYEHEDTLKTKDIVELYDKTVNAIGEK